MSSRETNEGEIVWESYRINGMGQKVTNEFLIVDSFKTGDRLIDELIKENYSDKMYKIKRNKKEHYAQITYKNNSMPGDQYFNITLWVYRHKVTTNSDVDRLMKELRDQKAKEERKKAGSIFFEVDGKEYEIQKLDENICY